MSDSFFSCFPYARTIRLDLIFSSVLLIRLTYLKRYVNVRISKRCFKKLRTISIVIHSLKEFATKIPRENPNA